ncbi:MAG TPA: hypothetical protein PLU22_28015, partial [Polyangiaceae bacterium]|nr:hypothetical protein [Polyangiaceae bacterium]
AELELPPPPPPPEPPTSHRPDWPVYLLGSLAVVGATSAIVFGVSARRDREDAATSCAPVCDDDTVDAIRRKAVVADVSTGVALGSLGAAVVLLAVRQAPRHAARSAWGVAVAPDGGRAIWRGEFR